MIRPVSARLGVLAIFFLSVVGKVHADEPPLSGPNPVPITPTVPAPLDLIWLVVRTSPGDPLEERSLGDWYIEINTIDDDGDISSPTYYGRTDVNGNAFVDMPHHLLSKPIVAKAYNNMLPPLFEEEASVSRKLQIFIPPYCYDQAPWLLGPVEDALWSYYKQAASKKAEAWNPSQVDCGTWLENLRLLIMSDEIDDELDDQDPDLPFKKEALSRALQKNQHLLTATRPPLCFEEKRHNAGSLDQGDKIVLSPTSGFIVVDDKIKSRGLSLYLVDSDPVVINVGRGTVENICGIKLADKTSLKINETDFSPSEHFWLDDPDFLGTIHQQKEVERNLDVAIFNTRLGNGKDATLDGHDDACAVTSLIEFTNVSDDERDLRRGTGIYLSNLFAESRTLVHLTSDGDNVVDNHDTWAVFKRDGDEIGEEKVIAVELLGHRQEDFRDVLHLNYRPETEDLFIGLRNSYELNEEEVDGEKAYLKYTIHVWDGTNQNVRLAIRKDLANCYEAADIWARQFFSAWHSPPGPLEAAEFAVRSQCFSNSRSNQRWLTEDAGFWSINTDHGANGNVIVNPGWLAPHMAFELYIQKFDEAVFKGPRTIVETDESGQLMTSLPTLVEGDRVLIKSTDKCCDNYDLVLPCVPGFSGFPGRPGVPYVPVVIGPQPPPPSLPVANS